MSRYAWVTLATNDTYSLGALVLAYSLKGVHTKYELAVMVTPGVTASMRSLLEGVYDNVYEVDIMNSNDEQNLLLLRRPELGITFTKLHCWRLTQYTKCVFLDADVLVYFNDSFDIIDAKCSCPRGIKCHHTAALLLFGHYNISITDQGCKWHAPKSKPIDSVLKNCDELFDREELSAAPDVGWPDCFNSGVFVYRPSNETYANLVKFALDRRSFDGGDQGLLNLYFSDWAHKDIHKHLPFIYNMCSIGSYSYLPAFKQFGDQVRIVHFIGSSKPWLQHFNTNTLEVSPSENYRHLKVVLQHWWDLFCSQVHYKLSPTMARINTSTASSCTTHFHNPVNSNELNCESNICSEKNNSNTCNDVKFWDPWEDYQPQAIETNKLDSNLRITYDLIKSLGTDDAIKNIPITDEKIDIASNNNYNSKVPFNDSNLKNDTHLSSLNFYESNDREVEKISTFEKNSIFENTPTFINTSTFENTSTSSIYLVPIPVDISKNESHSDENFHTNKVNVSNLCSCNGIPCTCKNQIPSIPLSDPKIESSNEFCHNSASAGQPNVTLSLDIKEAETNDEAGLAGVLSQVSMSDPSSPQSRLIEEQLRRQDWEVGNIDYLGRDSFDNIWKKICETVDSSSNAKKDITQVETVVSAKEVEQKTPASTQPISKETVDPPKAEIVEKPQPSEKQTDISIIEEPKISKQEEPQVSKQEELQVSKQEESQISKQEEPQISKQEEPQVSKQEELQVSKQEESQISKQEEPQVSKQEELQVSKQEDPVVSKQEEPPVSKQEPPVSKQEEPPVSKQEEPKVSKQEEPPVSKQEETPVPKQEIPQISKQEEKQDEKTTSAAAPQKVEDLTPTIIQEESQTSTKQVKETPIATKSKEKDDGSTPEKPTVQEESQTTTEPVKESPKAPKSKEKEKVAEKAKQEKPKAEATGSESQAPPPPPRKASKDGASKAGKKATKSKK